MKELISNSVFVPLQGAERLAVATNKSVIYFDNCEINCVIIFVAYLCRQLMASMLI